MKRIYKYEIKTPQGTEELSPVLAHKGAKIVAVAEQQGKIYVWMEVDPSADEDILKFAIYGTGWEMPDHPGKFLSSVFMQNGLVFHIYERYI